MNNVNTMLAFIVCECRYWILFHYFSDLSIERDSPKSQFTAFEKIILKLNRLKISVRVLKFGSCLDAYEYLLQLKV